ncbi:dash complex subunit [Grosmannia clavigera kw1407]|uniref:DASH complex subunit DAM1 n=1 Tax=Grosmannia clavigera (strain kw1407 / UAMH 11150) TaxID=655863 RepID=F0XEH0_GROCL|nr:dash complex subunit [Grosmannia clavigera kw1407]EFX03422.1 dash complex subunit [Grosmannia clavigera kw1407]
MATEQHGSSYRNRSTSRTHTSRPTTPLRPSSRSSFRESARGSVHGDASFPLNAFEPAFAELSDAMADLEANMMHYQLMHESLSRFSESFASFLYGLNMNAYCVDFPEGPISESFRRAKQRDESTTVANIRQESEGGATQLRERIMGDLDGETTFIHKGFCDSYGARWTRWTWWDRDPRHRKHPWRPTKRAGKTEGQRHTVNVWVGGLDMAAVLRYVAGTKKSPKGTLYLQCHIKPGASKIRQGVTAVTDDAIEICVLDVPKSSLQITRGLKSRDKTVAVAGLSETDDKAQELLDRVKILLSNAAGGSSSSAP